MPPIKLSFFVAALMVLFSAAAEQNFAAKGNNSTNAVSNSTSTTPTITSTTTTTPHVCVARSPCSDRSNCIAVGDSFICRCKDSFIGEDSADGDGCFRTSMRTIGTGMDKGLHITVGQGADVFVHAGGEIRGRSASIFAMVDSLEALLEQPVSTPLPSQGTRRMRMRPKWSWTAGSRMACSGCQMTCRPLSMTR